MNQDTYTLPEIRFWAAEQELLKRTKATRAANLVNIVVMHRAKLPKARFIGVCATCEQPVTKATTRPDVHGAGIRVHKADTGIVLTGEREFDPVAFAINTGDDESP